MTAAMKQKKGTYNEISKLLADVRISRNITQRDLADKIGVHHGYVARVEGGLVDDPKEYLEMISWIMTPEEKKKIYELYCDQFARMIGYDNSSK